MNSRRIIIGLAFISVGLAPLIVQAGSTWQSAQKLTIDSTPAITYGQFSREGQVNFYQFRVKQPETIRLELGQAIGFKDFTPRVVLYQPDGMTIGPLLPMQQPPQTIALVYPSKVTAQSFDVFTQVSYNQSLVAPVTLEQTGTYYLAVYNASTSSGRYRLTIDNGRASIADWSDAWQLPVRWWQDQAFAGLSWQTLFTPALLIVLIILVVEQLRFYHLHHLAPAKKSTRVKKRRS